jgi:trans-aconitate methyltransferase
MGNEPVSIPAVPGACPNFDRLAGAYRWLELAAFGPILQQCRCAAIHRLGCCRRALVLGDGDGRFTSRLLRANPTVTVDAVDASPAMLRELVSRAGPDAARVRVHLADARLWQPSGPAYDLIVTHFFLDCLTTGEVAALAKRVRGSAAEGATWVISEFAIPRNPFGRLVARPLVAALYRAFGLLTGLRVRSLPDYASALAAAGFRLDARRTWLAGLLTSESWLSGRTKPS